MINYKRCTVRLDLTDNEQLEQYDEIMNDPDCRVIEKTLEHKTETDFTPDEDGGGTSTTTKTPFWIVTYEVRELF